MIDDKISHMHPKSIINVLALDNMVLMMEVVIAWVIDISHAATLIV
jgi:hypothetical protein